MKNSQRGHWFEAEKICVATGSAVARNLMFESKRDHQLFHALWNKYLGGMTDVLRYDLTATGWCILFKTKSDSDIKMAYHRQRIKSKKAKSQNRLTQTKRMLSEHFRMFLSQFARGMNRNNKRRGTLVLETFQKYTINSGMNLDRIYTWIKQLVNCQPQPSKKYEADERQYDIDKKMTSDSIWKVGELLRSRDDGSEEVYGVMGLIPFTNSVLRKLVKKPKTHQSKPPFT